MKTKFTIFIVVVALFLGVYGNALADSNSDINPLVREMAAEIANPSVNPAIYKPAPGFYYFFTLGMSDNSIKESLEASKPIGAIMVLRGTPDNNIGSVIKVLKRFNDGHNETPVYIDPYLFEKYGIGDFDAPTLVFDPAIDPACLHCAPSEEYLKVTGDVTFRYALERMVEVDGRVKEYLERMINAGW